MKPTFLLPALLFAFIWTLFLTQAYFGYDVQFLMLAPHDKTSPYTILTSPFLHGSLNHIVSNSIYLLLYLSCIVYFYRHLTYILTVSLIIAPQLFTWIVGEAGSYHLGISGAIFGFVSFLIVAGFRRGDFIRVVLSLVILYSFREAFILIFPVYDMFGNRLPISWESHLGGFLTGIILAFILPLKNEQNSNH